MPRFISCFIVSLIAAPLALAVNTDRKSVV